jgi:hypothetical protein
MSELIAAHKGQAARAWPFFIAEDFRMILGIMRRYITKWVKLQVGTDVEVSAPSVT